MTTEQGLQVIPQRILEELNTIRTNPPSFVPYLTRKLEFYHEKLNFLESVPNAAVETKEGIKAPKELIEYLTNKEPLKPLEHSQILERAARIHARDLGEKGRYEHKGSDGSSLLERIQQFGEPEGHLVEVLECGYRNPKEILASLLIDDGMPGRPHMKTLLNDGLRNVGIAISTHPHFQYVTVIVLCEGEVGKGKNKVPERNTYIFPHSPEKLKASTIVRSSFAKNVVENEISQKTGECTCSLF